MKKFFQILTVCLVCCGAFTLPPYSVSAANNSICDISSIPAETREAAGCSENKVTVDDIIKNVLDAIILVSGTIAVVFVIVGGVKYITSTGNPAEIEKARKTIIYALIGLAICALAFVIVNFAVGVINEAAGEES